MIFSFRSWCLVRSEILPVQSFISWQFSSLHAHLLVLMFFSWGCLILPVSPCVPSWTKPSSQIWLHNKAGHQLCIHTARKFKHVWNENFKIGWLLLRVSQVRPTGPTPFLSFWEIQKLLFPLSLWCDISSNLLFLLLQFYFYLQFLPIIVYFISSLWFCHFLFWWHFDLFQTALYFNFLSQACWFMAVSFISFML